MKRLKVLIATTEFSPYQGSECGKGWNICTRLAKLHDVTVLCASGSQQRPFAYRNAVREYFAKNDRIDGLKILFVDYPRIGNSYARLNKKLFDVSDGAGFRPLYYRVHNLWSYSAYLVARNLDLKNYDLIHQLGPAGFRTPGYLWALNAPFFWGPIGGLHKVPFNYSKWLGIRSFIFESMRSLGNEFQSRISRNIISAARKAKLVWVITDKERDMIRKLSGMPKTEILTESSYPINTIGKVREYSGNRPLRICWSGRHDTTKALPILLRALSYFEKSNEFSVDILGSGRETERWKKLADKLGLRNINWHGWLPHHAALTVMGRADIFVHTSVREATSHVILEAMAEGIPIVCHDACGMAHVIDKTCGIKVPLISPDMSVQGFYRALQLMRKSPILLAELSNGALKRSALYSWDKKAEQISAGYVHNI